MGVQACAVTVRCMASRYSALGFRGSTWRRGRLARATRRADEELILAMSHDAEALGELLRRYGGLVRAECRQALPSRHLRLLDEAEAESLCDMVRGARGFRGATAAELREWMMVVARRRAWKVARAADRQARHEDAELDDNRSTATASPVDVSTEVVGRMASTELGDRVSYCLDKLSDMERELILLRHEGVPYATLGERFAKKAATLKVTVSRARSKLAACLGVKEVVGDA